MKSNAKLARALGFLLLWVAISWYLGTLLHLHGSNLWLLRIGLALLGLVGFAGYLWLESRAGGFGGGVASGSHEEVDVALHEAAARLQASNLGRNARISNLPTIFFLGDPGSAKTTTVLHSGLEPELLAGQVYHGDTVAPTRSLNLWFARQWLLVDPAGGLFADAASRQNLIRELAPLQLTSLLGRAESVPRAAVVCVDCESLVAPGAAEAMTARARGWREILGDISHLLGIRLPVYVLFTKMDRLAYFFEYAANLTEEEASQVFGVTLPMTSDSAGVYAEREMKRLTEIFSSLAFSLSDHRPDFLVREHDATKLPSIYEFPREFRKMRAVLVQFLVDLCRPSQLRASPYLRGFYFTGVRPVTLSDVAAATPAPQSQPRAFDADATRVFVGGGQALSPEAAHQLPATRRVPQWVFLSHIFSDVILQDQSAIGSSSSRAQLNIWRRALAVGAGVAALVLMAAWIVSFSGNNALSNSAVEAARGVQNEDVGADQLASSASLRRLDDVRQSLTTLDNYRRDGRPLRLAWGLYVGDQLYAPLHRIYSKAFRRLLLGGIQENLVTLLSRPSPTQDRGYIYNALKAYLITTSNPDKSTSTFLPPVLATHWTEGKAIDTESSDLAAKQFLFYSEELPVRNPYPDFAVPDDTATRASRAFLKRSATIEPLYQAMLAKVSSLSPALNFNKDYPGSAEVIINSYPVAGAFTKPGWVYMQKAIQNPGEYFSGEVWVLGPDAYANLDPLKMQQELQERYQGDFIKTWREFIRATRVVPYGSIPDAAKKLVKLSGNQSPLLSLLCVISDNTAVEAKPVADLFRPPQQVTPPGCHDRLAAPANAAYMDDLSKLLATLQALIANPTNDAYRGDALTSALGAESEVRQIARNFPVDKEGAVDAATETILEDPIKHVQALIAGVPKEEANGAGKTFCGQFHALMAKYPFQPSSSVEASMQDVGDMFRANDGALWKFYQETMQRFLVRQGNEYVAKPGTPAATPAFTAFFNRAAGVSAAFFGANAQQPQLSFSVRVNPTQDVEAVTLSIGAQTLKYSSGESAPQGFTWPGAGPPEVKLRVKFTGGSEFDYPGSSGPWAIFRFFSHFEHWQSSGSSSSMDWTLRAGADPVIVPKSGRPATVSLALDTGSAPNILRPGYFAGMTCAVPAVR